METTTAALDELQARILDTPRVLIGGRIKEARTGLSLSHDALGELLGGVTRQHLIKLEKAKHRPRAEMLQRIAEATGRTVDWFLTPPVAAPFQPGTDGH